MFIFKSFNKLENKEKFGSMTKKLFKKTEVRITHENVLFKKENVQLLTFNK